LSESNFWIDPLLTASLPLAWLIVQPDTATLATARIAVNGASR
jgi:hypothetical protein